MKLQKRAVRIINKVTCLFIQSSVQRFHDIVYLRTLELMHRVVNKDIPVVIEGMSELREGQYNSRGSLMFSSAAGSNVKYRCVSVLGVK